MRMAPRTRAARKIASIVVAPLMLVPVTAIGLLTAGSATAQAPNEVTMTPENMFAPAMLEVPVGTEVTWTNASAGFHSVTGGDGAPDATSPIGDNPLESATATVKKLFDKPGTYPYFCKPHASVGMKGTIVVTAAGASPAAGSGSPAASGSATGAAGSVAPSGSGEATNSGAAQSQTASASPVAAGSGAPDENLGGPDAVALDERLSEKGKPLTTFRLGLWALTLGILLLGGAVYFITKSPRDEA
ncbi:MAG: plastocyanin/azurin family copper-binding protein [Mycobacteriales bacterium]